MQLIKLVYICHGWHLAQTGEPLIEDKIQAWQYGPVISDLYRHYKKYGNQPIVDYAKELNFNDDSVEFKKPFPDLDDDEKDLIETIFDVYGKFEAFQLSALTHKKGTPWYNVWHEGGGNIYPDTVIQDSAIKNHFLELAKQYNDEK